MLCAASHAQTESVAQVLSSNDKSDTPASPPSAAKAENVWQNAYNQWIASASRSGAGPAPAVDKAMRAARERLANGAISPGEGGEQKPGPKPRAEDDELTVVTRAVHVLADGDTDIDSDAVLDAVQTIESLCSSGDNGRQVASTGGIAHLLRIISTASGETGVWAAKAVASCAQNNGAVLARAAADGAVGVLLRYAAAEAGGGVGMQAAALRGLVALAGGEEAREAMRGLRGEVVEVVVQAVRMAGGREERRCAMRGLALVEGLLRAGGWRESLRRVGQVAEERARVGEEDTDVRELAATVVVLLRGEG